MPNGFQIGSSLLATGKNTANRINIGEIEVNLAVCPLVRTARKNFGFKCIEQFPLFLFFPLRVIRNEFEKIRTELDFMICAEIF